MPEIIDLSQEIFHKMPVYKVLPEVTMEVHATHEQWEGITDADTYSPSVYKLQLSEHTGTHVDALNHMAIANYGQSIDSMPLSMFYTRGVCLDFRNKGLLELIEPDELQTACVAAGVTITKGDTVLLCTNHYTKNFGTANWAKGPGITVAAAEWLAAKQVAAFGVETMSPGVPGISNKQVHHICGQYGFTHYENMINLEVLLGRGAFRFIALPLKIRGGTGSPVRAVAIFE